jgi:FMN phosphatase YigB (HAD superfamily)
MDGVVVDNVSFDGGVTERIVRMLAEQREISLSEAKRSWGRELADTRTDYRWYDYNFHCERLGLRALAAEAHNALADRLRLVRGADLTLDLLRRSGLDVVIATDAVRAVAEFKLRRLGIGVDLIVSSQSVGAPKSSTVYWRRVRDECVGRNVRVLIENRLDNISAARSQLGGLTNYIHFAFDEHVTRLTADVRAPARRPKVLADVLTVSTHRQLRRVLTSLLL